MKKKMYFAVLFLIAAGLASAQLPTYNLDKPFACDASNTNPLKSFYQFDCRGPAFTNPNDGTTLNLFWFSVLGFYVSPCCTLGVQGTRKYQVNLDTPPANGQPGVFQVQFQYQTTDGVTHQGIWSGTWVVIAGYRGAQRPYIETGTLQFE